MLGEQIGFLPWTKASSWWYQTLPSRAAVVTVYAWMVVQFSLAVAAVPR
jgi:hypothetical protein